MFIIDKRTKNIYEVIQLKSNTNYIYIPVSIINGDALLNLKNISSVELKYDVMGSQKYWLVRTFEEVLTLIHKLMLSLGYKYKDIVNVRESLKEDYENFPKITTKFKRMYYNVNRNIKDVA